MLQQFLESNQQIWQTSLCYTAFRITCHNIQCMERDIAFSVRTYLLMVLSIYCPRIWQKFSKMQLGIGTELSILKLWSIVQVFASRKNELDS